MPILLFLLACILPCFTAEPSGISAHSQQLIIGITNGWESSHGKVQLFTLNQGQWVATTPAFKARFGRNGLKWGLGRHINKKGVDLKKEGDGCTPAGIFALGDLWGYAPSCEKHRAMKYHQITPRHLWVEDVKSPSYNQPLLLSHNPRTPWEKKAQMRQNDYAHSLKLFIKHNTEPQPTPGMGSSIFFHIWRKNGQKPTAGCTTMSESNLRKLVKKIDPRKNPLYVVLPASEYAQQKLSWMLP